VYIGDTLALGATEALSNGASRPAANVTWSSDNLTVATVSSTGLLTAIGPGESTIVAETSHRTTLRIRVYPNFAGRWRGTEIIDSCSDTGDLDGLCAELDAVGEAYLHDSTVLQTDASVNAVLDVGDGVTATMAGAITTDGEAQLGSAPLLPAEPDIVIEIRNWRTRANQPGQMTGSYAIVIALAGYSGEVTMGMRLASVIKTSISPTHTRDKTTGLTRKLRQITVRARR
jgi:hypothetical protein